MSIVSSNQSPDFAWLLEGLAREVPDIRGSVLLSSDGLMKATHGLDQASSEYLAALASGLYSMARGAANKFDGNNEVRQVIAELKSSQMYISWAGSNTVLAVLAKGEADPAVIGLEMARLIRAVRPFLDTATRSQTTAPAAGNSWA